jgi:hypothetical protein
MRARKATPRRKTRRDFHSIVLRPSCAWPERVALGTRITIIRSPHPGGKSETRMKNKKKTRARRLAFPSLYLAICRLFSSSQRPVRDQESGRRTKNGNVRGGKQHAIHTGFPLPLYRNTLVRRSVSIVHSGDRERERERERGGVGATGLDDFGLKWRRVYNRTGGGIYGTATERRTTRETASARVPSSPSFPTSHAVP